MPVPMMTPTPKQFDAGADGVAEGVLGLLHAPIDCSTFFVRKRGLCSRPSLLVALDVDREGA
ncbi:hypothetical protein SALBM217S_01068 [Streptomyces griseoloalbus]